MGYTVEWYPGYEGRVVHEILTGDVTMDEVAAAAHEVARHLREARGTAHVFINLEKMGRFPLRANQLKDASVFLSAPNLGMIALIGGSSLMGTFGGIIGQLAGIKVRSFTAYDEALAFVARQDTTPTNR